MTHLLFWFTILVSIFPLVKGHGCLTKVVANGQTACAVNARDAGGCTPTNNLKLRTLIARSGNEGACAQPPGCEASFSCDWCALEKVQTFNQVVAGKWWTGMPAAHWDNPATDPVFPCMSKDTFGKNGQMTVQPGTSITANFYINADHSGLYRYELLCGNTAANDQFAPITAWLALHKDKDGAPLGADRVVGYTRADTDDYFRKTTCSGGGCSYRMNRGVQGPDSAHCKGNIADCYDFDTFTIPSNTQCRGDAILRWHWNSAEGPEAYANCLDLKIEGGDAPPPPPTPATNPPTPIPNSPTPIPNSPTPATNPPTTETVVTEWGCASGRLSKSDDCRDNPSCCEPGYTCYKKDDGWGGCRNECIAQSINPDDPKLYQTPWECTTLGTTYPDHAQDSGHAPAPPVDSGAQKKNSIFFGIIGWICFMLLLV